MLGGTHPKGHFQSQRIHQLTNFFVIGDSSALQNSDIGQEPRKGGAHNGVTQVALRFRQRNLDPHHPRTRLIQARLSCLQSLAPRQHRLPRRGSGQFGSLHRGGSPDPTGHKILLPGQCFLAQGGLFLRGADLILGQVQRPHCLSQIRFRIGHISLHQCQGGLSIGWVNSQEDIAFRNRTAILKIGVQLCDRSTNCRPNIKATLTLHLAKNPENRDMLAQFKGHGIDRKNALATTAAAPLIVASILDRAPDHHDRIGQQRQSRRH